MKCTIFIDMLLLIGAVYLFSMCSNGNRTTYNDNTTHASYNINHYIDTVNGHIILTTVCDASNVRGAISVSTLELENWLMLKLKFDRNSNKSGKDKIETFTTHGVLVSIDNNDFKKGLMISYVDTTDRIIIRILKDTKIQIIND